MPHGLGHREHPPQQPLQGPRAPLWGGISVLSRGVVMRLGMGSALLQVPPVFMAQVVLIAPVGSTQNANGRLNGIFWEIAPAF